MKKATVKIMTLFGYEAEAEKLAMSTVLGNDGSTLTYKIEAINGSHSVVVATYEDRELFLKAFGLYSKSFIDAQTKALGADEKKNPAGESDLRD